ncbi:MAG TPA: amino acid adenylation domain-containing protein, partial [Verrucomicrobiae bacterium]|nr:amino acid adenylation domain-containing protein [Verrucomicrobiae bacterium]
PPADIFAFPVSSAQQRLWFLEQFQPGSPLYNSPIAVRMDGPLDATVLEQAINRIIRRHETLRTSFDLQNGRPVQLVAPSLTLQLPVSDLSSLPPASGEAEARRLAADEARRPFDLQRLPLLRVKLLRLSATRHVFVLTVHHIIFDGWSLGVFLRELATIYESLHAGKTAELPEPPIQYADFAVWQQEQSEFLDKELAFWKKQLSGRLPTLELPTDRPRPVLQTYSGAVESLALPADLRDALQALSRREGVTLFMTLLAAFQTLLHRYTAQEDVLVGSPVAGRNLTETEGLIGLFIHTLLLRGDLSGNPTFHEFLRRVREMAVDAYANEEVPFDRIVEALHPERSLSHSPLFQVMFALERAPLESVNWPGLKLTQLELDSGTAKFDLTLYLVEYSTGLTARMEYNTDLFGAATIQRMLTHFKALLEGILAGPDKRLSELPLLTETERHRLLVECNRTQTDYPQEKTISALYEAQAARTPDAVAVVFGEQHLTYRELNQAANQLAHHLRKLGVQPDTLVGVCLDRSLDLVVGLLGILKAGGAYLPLDPSYPQERLAFMLEDSQAPVVVTQRRLTAALPKGRGRFVCLDSEWKLIAREDQENPGETVSPEDLAYVIYTSGSTGKPKGVQIPHRAVVNFLCSMRREPGLTSEDTLLAVTTLSFDIAALELFLPLSVGARVVLATREEAADGAQLAAKIADTCATVMQATPATWRLLIDSGWPGNKSLRVFCGGEALPRELANRLLERCAELWNLYGPTEATIWSAAAKIEPGNAPVVIGRPIANTQFYILDRYLQPVPVGVPGELLIGGDGLARGYLNRPELTAEKFIRHPFSDTPNARAYRTGDLARRSPDGNIELLGRMDHQVKIRGFRIELGEIEAVLLQFTKVREAVVVAREDVPGDKRLVAYLTTYRQSAVSLNELRRFLREKFPDYMVPSAFVMLEQLPLTPNGKVDRRALPKPENHRLKSDTTFVAPGAGLEQDIAAVWEEVLFIKNPGVNDNFFDLGGHSLQVVQVQNKLRERLGADLPVIKLFEYPTIRSLAGCLGEKKKEEPLAQKVQERTQRQKAAAGQKQFGARVRL